MESYYNNIEKSIKKKSYILLEILSLSKGPLDLPFLVNLYYKERGDKDEKNRISIYIR